MKKWIIGVVVFIVVYLVFLATQIPAQWAINQIALPKHIALYGINGSVWHTSIDRIMINNPGYDANEGYSVNQVTTEVNLLSFLIFNPSVTTTFGGPLVSGPEGQATLSQLSGDIEISDLKISAPANDIAQQLTLPIELTAQKFIDINVDEFVMGKPLCQQLSGTVAWENAGVKAFDQSVDLGALNGTLACDKGAVKFTFNPKNNLGLTLTAHIYSPERISGKGYIIPGNKFPAKLNDLLPFIGQKDNQGRYPLNF